MRIHGHVGFKIFKVNTKIQHGLVSLFRNLFALNERAYRTLTARYCTEKKGIHLRVVKTIAILFLKSMSERNGSDIDFKNKMP